MPTKDTIKKILGKVKDIGLPIPTKGIIKGSSAIREAIKRFGVPRETIKGIPEAAKKVGKKILEYSPAGLAGGAIREILKGRKNKNN